MKKIISILLTLAMLATTALAVAEEINVISREDGSGTRGAFIELFGTLPEEAEEVIESGKELEKKAAETAQMILDIRDQRLRIVTGDTDATYSGEAMGAAIDELTRLEKEYLMLFVGYSEFQTQKMNFEVIPQPGETQMYIAFRLSDTAGLVPADNLSGKPVVMEIVPQKFSEPEGAPESAKAKKGVSINYRIPAICNVKLLDGVNMLLQSRIPVYQLGRESSTFLVQTK